MKRYDNKKHKRFTVSQSKGLFFIKLPKEIYTINKKSLLRRIWKWIKNLYVKIKRRIK